MHGGLELAVGGGLSVLVADEEQQAAAGRGDGCVEAQDLRCFCDTFTRLFSARA